MLPFGLKIAWFVLSLSGLLSCWIVLWAFGRAVGAKWGTSIYSVGISLLEGMFCLGMIYRMDPFSMPRGFCVAQTIIMSFGTFLIAGLAMAFSMATSIVVLKPKTWSDGERALKWRNIYSVPVVGFPIVASTIHVILLVHFDSIHPTDDMLCESSKPEWVRFIRYAGVVFFLSCPSLYLSIKSIYHVYKINQHLLRARPEIVDDLTSWPPLSRKREVSFITRAFLSSTHTTPTRRQPLSPKVHSPALLAGRFHLPFRFPSRSLPLTMETRGSADGDIDLNDDASSSKVSVSFPAFTNPGSGTTSAGEHRVREGSETGVYEVGNRDPSLARDWKEDSDLGARPSDSVNDREEDDWEGKGASTESDIAEEYVMSETVPYSSARPRSRGFSAMRGMGHKKSRPPPPTLAPAIWRIILFQVGFIFVQFLSCISTVIDVIKRRPTPTPLGTHHFALLLAAWGPVIIFGHLPAVRRNLIPWRPIS